MKKQDPNHVPRLAAGVLGAVLALGTLGGCAAVLVGGAVGGALMATDRRTSGAQVEDEAIELKAASRARAAAGDRAHVNITSYNRVVLLTGEVADEATRTQIERAVSSVENLRSVVNELAVMGQSSLTARSNDTILTSKVKAAFVDAADVQAMAVKVVTERATVHLMGRVTEREAARATEVARNVGGVQRVVRVFEVISEDELARLQPPRATTPATTTR